MHHDEKSAAVREGGHASKRRSRRFKIFEPIRIRTRAGEQRAHLIDVSQTGALVHAMPAPECGDPVVLWINAYTMSAKVMWVAGPRFGISFSTHLDDRVLADFLTSQVGSLWCSAWRPR